MNTNKIKPSRIKAAGNNLKAVGYSMIALIIIPVIQWFFTKDITNVDNPQIAIVVFMVLYIVFTIIIISNLISAGNNLLSCEFDGYDSINVGNSNDIVSKLNVVETHAGEIRDGGIIVYTDQAGTHGLVCATNDLGIKNWNDSIKLCEEYKAGDFSDWRLPNKEELALIYSLLYKNKGLGSFTNDFYWSSTELNSSSAWLQNFSDGKQNASDFGKGKQCNVRAVRTF